jgi:predicted TIM-barrel fold metal-dependent hydrolase
VQVSLAQEANDFIAEAVKKYPKRLAAFAALPIAAPEKAADEFNRRVRREGFKGALINGHTRGRYLDERFFSPVLERAEALNVPIYTCIRPYRRSPSWMHFTLVLLLR